MLSHFLLWLLLILVRLYLALIGTHLYELWGTQHLLDYMNLIRGLIS